MKVLIASDHAGFALKQALKAHLQGAGHEVVDLGAFSADPADYPDFAHALAQQIQREPGARGILICATGIGMSMAANRHPGVRAALCHDAYTAEMARRHNDANILCLGGKVTGEAVARQMVEIFLATPFDGGRHSGRVAKLEAYHGPA
ncbi:MAG: ribose 5-phosphate isomerase B [Thermoanaerobaculum sp.]|nr:ribose 5-phosphate isomerase B [Thermoanaerobaculum sp.]MDW7966863.1 ribose 5-phosphate isomerase B [Thermoanaerobaculum sp.]